MVTLTGPASTSLGGAHAAGGFLAHGKMTGAIHNYNYWIAPSGPATLGGAASGNRLGRPEVPGPMPQEFHGMHRQISLLHPIFSLVRLFVLRKLQPVMANRKLGCLSIFLFVALCASMFMNLVLAITAFRRLS